MYRKGQKSITQVYDEVSRQQLLARWQQGFSALALCATADAAWLASRNTQPGYARQLVPRSQGCGRHKPQHTCISTVELAAFLWERVRRCDGAPAYLGQVFAQCLPQCAFLSVLMVCRFVLQVAVLFKNHNDLLTQFTYFLPDNSPPQVRRHLKQYAWASCGMVHQPALQYTCSS